MKPPSDVACRPANLINFFLPLVPVRKKEREQPDDRAKEGEEGGERKRAHGKRQAGGQRKKEEEKKHGQKSCTPINGLKLPSDAG